LDPRDERVKAIALIKKRTAQIRLKMIGSSKLKWTKPGINTDEINNMERAIAMIIDKLPRKIPNALIAFFI
jgi:hypothetical protein